MTSLHHLIADRAQRVDASGIRKVFDLARDMKNPVNFSIGQPDFPLPPTVLDALQSALHAGHTAYTPTQGIAPLREAITRRLDAEFGWNSLDDRGLLITSGVSGALMLAILATVQAGDEVIFLDPYFVMYRHIVTMAGGTSVCVSAYPDFQLPGQAILDAVTARTKMVILNSPANPTGAVYHEPQLRPLVLELEQRGILVISDEIYDLFCYEPFTSCAPYAPNVMLMRGFSKTYAMTGLRLAYAVGPRHIIEEMTKLQQFSFVCAPAPAQHAGIAALNVDMTPFVTAYRARRDRLLQGLAAAGYNFTTPGGSFYVFPEVPPQYPSAQEFVRQAIAHELLIIPGNVFSARDTHFRISYACPEPIIDRGLEILDRLARLSYPSASTPG